MKLVDGEHSGGWIVDSLRQRLDSDIDNNPECERRVLLDSPLRAECDLPTQQAVADRRRAVVQMEKRFTDRYKIADPRDELDHTARGPGKCHQRLQIDGKHNCRGPTVLHG